LKIHIKPLTSHERQKPHRSGLFYGAGEKPLMLGANARVPRVNDLALAGNKTPQELNFLIIDLFGILGTKKALFG
jgi:hypothetical protein